MVELGEHCHTHIIPRLKKVIDGTDQGGVSKAVGWQGGGGFQYYRLAPSLLEKDAWGNWVISKEYNAAMLAEAMCKHEGFTYAPSDTFYWQHGHSTERDFIYVTTQTLTHQQLAHLADEVGDERTLLVCCAAYRANPDAFPNLTLKKIPNAVLNRCEFGVDDYSLKIAESGNGTGTALTPAPSPVDTGEGSLVQPTPTRISPSPAPAGEGAGG
jgi:adenine-specific DNA-methyltransferase